VKHTNLVPVLAAAVIFLFGCDAHRSDDPEAGDEAVFYSQNGADILAAISSESHDRMIKLSVAKDYLGLGEMESAKKVFLVKPGTTCQVIDPGAFNSEVRITNGPYFGKSLFVAPEQLRRK
jgi:hypothetical protein